MNGQERAGGTTAQISDIKCRIVQFYGTWEKKTKTNEQSTAKEDTRYVHENLRRSA